MHMSIFKKNYSFFCNYFNIYDIKGKKIKLSIILIILTFIKSLKDPVPYFYIVQIKNQFKFKGFDRMFEYGIPLIALFIIIYVFFEDYKDKTYNMIEFYNIGKFNHIMFFRFIFPIGIIMSGSFISGLIYYRNISFLNLNNILLSIRFTPNILFVCSLFLFITATSKNVYAGIATTTTYMIIDYFSNGNFFKILSIGTNMNNSYYCNSPMYYFTNRIIIILLSVMFLLLSCKKNRLSKCFSFR